MKYELIHLNGFMYAVNKEARPKKDQWVFETHNPIVQSVCQTLRDYTDKDNTTDKVVIATTDPSLSLPLLPAVEEDVAKLALDATNSEREKDIKRHNSNSFIDYTLPAHCESIKDREMLFKKIFLNRSQDFKRGFEDGYKAASPKQFTEDDFYNFIQIIAEKFPSLKSLPTSQAEDYAKVVDALLMTKDEFVQSLKPKPVAVLVEVSSVNYDESTFYPIVDANNFVKVKQWYYE